MENVVLFNCSGQTVREAGTKNTEMLKDSDLIWEHAESWVLILALNPLITCQLKEEGNANTLFLNILAGTNDSLNQ